MFTTTNFPVTFDELSAYAQAKPTNDKGLHFRKLCHNTYVEMVSRGTALSVILYNTPVIAMSQRQLTWSTGNWRTRTTAQRINRFLGPEGYFLSFAGGASTLYGDMARVHKVNDVMGTIWLRNMHLIHQVVL